MYDPKFQVMPFSEFDRNNTPPSIPGFPIPKFCALSTLQIPLCSVHLTGEFQKEAIRNSRAVQWLGLCAFIAKDLGSVLGWGTKIPQAMLHGQEKKGATEIKVKLFKNIF